MIRRGASGHLKMGKKGGPVAGGREKRKKEEGKESDTRIALATGKIAFNEIGRRQCRGVKKKNSDRRRKNRLRRAGAKKVCALRGEKTGEGGDGICHDRRNLHSGGRRESRRTTPCRRLKKEKPHREGGETGRILMTTRRALQFRFRKGRQPERRGRRGQNILFGTYQTTSLQEEKRGVQPRRI